MRRLRCALHRFNQETVLPGPGVTIDETLILLAQLSSERKRVRELARRQPKQGVKADRFYGRSSSAPEYLYANYDVAEAQGADRDLQDCVMALQLALDAANQTLEFEA